MDEDFINRRVLQLLFSEFGRCDTADNGILAISHFEEALKNRRPYNLLIMDIMSQGNWVELLNKIKSIEKGFAVYGKDGARIIIMSSDLDKKTILSAFKNQCDAFIQKPAKKRDLLNAVSCMGIKLGNK